MKALAIIPARAGSRSIPLKNVAPLAGRPLIAWTIDAAQAAPRIHRTVVSSDSPEILRVARRYGAEAIHRPGALATDETPSEPVVMHALDVLLRTEGWVPDVTVLLQPTSPLRTAQDVNFALEFLDDPEVDSVISVFEPTHSPFKCFVQRYDGFLEGLVSDEAPFMRRQDLPRALMPNGAIYAVRTDVFRVTECLLGPATLPYEMPASRSIDIDEPGDLVRAETRLRPALAS